MEGRGEVIVARARREGALPRRESAGRSLLWGGGERGVAGKRAEGNGAGQEQQGKSAGIVRKIDKLEVILTIDKFKLKEFLQFV